MQKRRAWILVVAVVEAVLYLALCFYLDYRTRVVELELVKLQKLVETLHRRELKGDG